MVPQCMSAGPETGAPGAAQVIAEGCVELAPSPLLLLHAAITTSAVASPYACELENTPVPIEGMCFSSTNQDDCR
jgi:hypothetical protein